MSQVTHITSLHEVNLLTVYAQFIILPYPYIFMGVRYAKKKKKKKKKKKNPAEIPILRFLQKFPTIRYVCTCLHVPCTQQSSIDR